MKWFIVIVHVLLGLILIFSILNSQVTAYNKIHNTESYYSSEDLTNSGIINHIEGLKRSESQRITEGIIGIILGVLSIVGALAFRKDKQWAVYTLPIVTLVLSIAIIYISKRSPLEGLAAAATGISMLFAVILLIFFILEVLYIIFRKKTESN